NAGNIGGSGFMLVGPPIVNDATSMFPDNFFPPMKNAPAPPPDDPTKTPYPYNRRPTLSGTPVPDYQEKKLSIKVTPEAKGKQTAQNPTLVLQRLADPTRKASNPNDDPTIQDWKDPTTYNPWVTVDYFENIWTNNSFVIDANDPKSGNGPDYLPVEQVPP